MAMNVRQAFLDCAEEGNFHLLGQASEIVGDVESRVNVAALGEAIHVPANCRSKTDLVEQGRMKKMRDCADLFTDLVDHHLVFVDHASDFRSQSVGLFFDGRSIDSDSDEQLSDTVMQITSDAPAFFILKTLQPRSKFVVLLLRGEVGDQDTGCRLVARKLAEREVSRDRSPVGATEGSFHRRKVRSAIATEVAHTRPRRQGRGVAAMRSRSIPC